MGAPNSLWADLLNRFESVGASAAVTHYTLSLGSASASTGCYSETYSAGASINMLIVTKATQSYLFGTGIYVKRDVAGVTDTAVVEGDKIKDANNIYYRVISVKPHVFGNVTVYYETELTVIPFHEL